MTRLFGTDGVRGIAGEHAGDMVGTHKVTLDCKLACALGRAAARTIGPRVLIGRDSRTSGPMLERALVAGIRSEGGVARVAGVIPTPAIAFLTARTRADCGIVISASHNPPEYNGIKFFDFVGYKLPDAVENDLASLTEELMDCPPKNFQPAELFADASARYVEHAVHSVRHHGIDFSGIKIALDCANGAASFTTPAALRELGAQLVTINSDADGSRINVDCGSTHLDALKELMRDSHADIGFAHDGDADRLLALTPDGAVVDGDFILAICAKDMKERDCLKGNVLVSTIMSNLGFIKAMQREGIQLVSTKVGDRYVLEAMRENGAILGGEQSGHVIFLKHNTTGDGLVSALQILEIMVRRGKDIVELMQVMERFPQTLLNVAVNNKFLYEQDTVLKAAEKEAARKLGQDGRVFLRPSGTEPLIRVTVEAPTQKSADEIAQNLANLVRERMGKQ